MSSLTAIATTGPLLLAVAVSALAGLVSFASPCVVPLVPGYLSYLAAVVGIDETPEPGTLKAPPAARWRWRVGGTVRRRVHRGVPAGLDRRARHDHHADQQPGAAGADRRCGNHRDGTGVHRLRAALQRQVRFNPRQLSTVLGAPLLGAVFALGWTPCLGPTLTGVIAVASATDGSGVARGWCW